MTTYQTDFTPISITKLGGGLNTTAGPLNLQDNESSDLQNIDFDKFGSAKMRNGYEVLNSTAISVTELALGLHWYQTASAQKAINVSGDAIYRMDTTNGVPDGTWDTITGPALTTGAIYHLDFATFNGKVLITNDIDAPQKWANAGTCSNMTVVTGLTRAKFITIFQNYCLMANVVVSGVDSPTRFYWSSIKDEATWNAADFLEVGYNDGQEITGFKVLGDILICYKTNSIYRIAFTGDANIPFVIDKTNSDVGCVAPWSIQEVNNGHVFLSWDGLYFFDGNNSYKVSDRISDTIRNLNRDQIEIARSAYQQDKNRYWLSAPDGTSSKNNLIITWDAFNNSFSKYAGISASALAVFRVNTREERIYFQDYLGYTYRADYGTDDYPTNTKTAINSYCWTNWKNFGDVCDRKGIPHCYVYYSKTNADLTFAYAYDFNTTDQYSSSFSMNSGDSVASTISSSNLSRRRDLDGRGRVVRFKFAKNSTGSGYQIDGLGIQAGLQTRA